MVAPGALVPARVIRYAPQNVASIAGLMITTVAMVGDLQKMDAPVRGHGHGAGMGGMDL